jgi:hypothetical protein
VSHRGWVISEEFHNLVGEVHGPFGLAGLGIAEVRCAVLVPALERAADVDDAVLEVNITPPERVQLGCPEAGVRGRQHERPVRRVRLLGVGEGGDGVGERVNLVLREDRQFLARRTRLLEPVARIRAQSRCSSSTNELSELVPPD